MNRKQSAITVAVLTFSMAVGLLIGVVFAQLRGSSEPTAGELARPATPNEGVNERRGTEIVAVLLTSSTCSASRTEGLIEAVSRLRDEFGATALQSGKHFISVAVAIDHDPAQGLAFLERFGSFNELHAGGGWLNLGSLQVLIRDSPGQLALPQLVLLERDIDVSLTDVSVSADRILARYVGASTIIDRSNARRPLANLQ